MNLFRTSPDPVESAVVLADRHVVKMALESTQILSTVVGGPYKPTHPNHPSVRWAGAARGHAAWVLAHGLALCEEYRRRFGKVHACAAVLDTIRLAAVPDLPSTEPLFVGPEAFARFATVEEQYRDYLACKYATWGAGARWTNRTRPLWV